MNLSDKDLVAQLSVDQWDIRYQNLKDKGLSEPEYGGHLSRHIRDGDYRLKNLRIDSSEAALDLWNFLLTEEARLKKAKERGKLIVATMKDLGTVPVMVYSIPNAIAFYPDGAWWIPCIMELSAGLFDIANSHGLDESFCPVRAMLGAFVNGNHFPKPDLLISSSGAICDDFSVITQRLAGLGYPIKWWEIPRRRESLSGENMILPGEMLTDNNMLILVQSELKELRITLEQRSGFDLNNEALSNGIRAANEVRSLLNRLRETVFWAQLTPIPALEMLICEMLVIHFCSDLNHAKRVLRIMGDLAEERVSRGLGYFPNAVKVFWVNPVADLRLMNVLEESGGRICGTEYLFSHALDQIPEDIPPMEALAQAALADPMVGPTQDRAERVVRDAKRYGAEALIISRIPGASHCAIEGTIIADIVGKRLEIPTLEIEVPSITDSMLPSLRTRIEALIETASQTVSI